MNISTEPKGPRDGKARGGYLEYVIVNDKDCRMPLTETARMKLIASNAEADGSYCIILWTCRTSRQGVHAFCTTTKISHRQRNWISAQYKLLRLLEIKVVHDQDYKDGKCFNKRRPF